MAPPARQRDATRGTDHRVGAGESWRADRPLARCGRTTASPSPESSRRTRTTPTIRSCGSSCRARRTTSSSPRRRAVWPTWLLWSLLAAAVPVLGVLALARLNSRRHLRALRETDARYRQLLAMTPEAVLVHAGGRILFTNPAAAELLGVANEHALVGRPIADFADAGVARCARRARPTRRADARRACAAASRSPRASTLDVEISSSPCVYHDQPAVVVLARDISGTAPLRARPARAGAVDELTGPAQPARLHAVRRAGDCARAPAADASPMLVFADLDDLKGINDVHGHASGDAAIRLVATAFKSILRETDIVARWSGDEFVALLSDGDPRRRRADRRTARCARSRVRHRRTCRTPSARPSARARSIRCCRCAMRWSAPTPSSTLGRSTRAAAAALGGRTSTRSPNRSRFVG